MVAVQLPQRGLVRPRLEVAQEQVHRVLALVVVPARQSENACDARTILPQQPCAALLQRRGAVCMCGNQKSAGVTSSLMNCSMQYPS